MHTFTVLQSGGFLIAGEFAKAPKGTQGAPQPGKRFAAIFDASGRLIKDLNITGKVKSGEVADTAATRGPDGYTYFARPDEILEISPDGGTIRRIPFSNPYRGGIPSAIRFSQGLISITLSKVDEKTGLVELRFLVLDAATGDVEGYYEPSQDLGNSTMCFSRTNGYTFLHLTKEGNTDEILTAALQ